MGGTRLCDRARSKNRRRSHPLPRPSPARGAQREGFCVEHAKIPVGRGSPDPAPSKKDCRSEPKKRLFCMCRENPSLKPLPVSQGGREKKSSELQQVTTISTVLRLNGRSVAVPTSRPGFRPGPAASRPGPFHPAAAEEEGRAAAVVSGRRAPLMPIRTVPPFEVCFTALRGMVLPPFEVWFEADYRPSRYVLPPFEVWLGIASRTLIGLTAPLPLNLGVQEQETPPSVVVLSQFSRG